MNPETLVAINVGLPVVSALALLILNDKRIRTAIVSLSTLVLISSAFLLYQSGGIVFSPEHIYEQAVVALASLEVALELDGRVEGVVVVADDDV